MTPANAAREHQASGAGESGARVERRAVSSLATSDGGTPVDGFNWTIHME